MSTRPLTRFRRIVGIVALAAVYTAVARAGLALYAVGGFAALVWPPTGLSLAALLLLGRWLWPGVLVGAMAVNSWVGAPPLVSAGIAIGNTLGTVAAVALLRRLSFSPQLGRTRDVLALLLAAILTSIINASIGVGSLRAGGVIPEAELWLAFRAWWMGDALGYLVVGPLLLTWGSSDPQQLPLRRRPGELVALVGVTLLVGFMVFLSGEGGAFRQPFLVLPVVLWAAMRFDQRAAATSTAGLSALAIAATVSGLGPFAGNDMFESLASLQVFVGSMAMGALALGAVVVERARAETALGENHALLAAIVEGTSDAVFAKDLEGRYLLINKAGARFIGKQIEEIVGQDDRMLFPSDSARVVREMDRALLLDGETRTVEESLNTAVGPVSFHSIKGPLRDSLGRVAGLVGISRDITQRIRTEAELRRAVAVRDEFLSIASHELRTPLSVLTLELAALERMFGRIELGDVGPRIRDKAARVNRQADRLTRLVERLLEVSRIESGRLELELVEVDLGELASELVDRLTEEAAKAGSPLTLTAAPGIRGRWDPVRLEQVLMNLIGNALKFGAGQPVQVEVTRDGELGRFMVRDRGIGLAAEDVERIFGRFERAVPTRHFGGLGLGLYIARQIIEAHGGTISAGTAEGGGAVFEVRLPLAQASAEPVQPT